MIVQCEACQTRFRLADEKVKPGGTKVRCSKCKVVFTVTPPEPEPAEEAVDFDSLNMEAVNEGSPSESSSGGEGPPDSSEPDDQPENSVPDFSSLEAKTEQDSLPGEELADSFSVADTSQSSEEEANEQDIPEQDAGSLSEELPGTEEQAAFETGPEENEDPEGPVEFDFSDPEEADQEAAAADSPDALTEETAGPSEFSFDEDEDEPQDQDEPAGFVFDDQEDETAFSFDDTDDETSPDSSEENDASGEFSFDDENPFDEDASSTWDDDTSGGGADFDFDEPHFDTEDSPAAGPAKGQGEDDLQFGEIDFASDDKSQAPAFQIDDDFSGAAIERKEETEPLPSVQPRTPPPTRDYDDGEPLPTPPPAKKSSLSRILVLLVLLLVVLGGAAGFLFMQEGSLNLNVVTQYLPFLQEYIGEDPVIQGEVVNNHTSPRSIITVKGVLLDAQAKPLLQQTVFCGNKLDNTALETMPFKEIEEAMNNQFGAATSNMNVAPGAKVPFTIVFRNLPNGITNINVEVVSADTGTN
jgi:predicted Zn finger-like uncharacterized protein